MKTKISIKSIFGKLLFEFEKENNTIKDTIREAVLYRADLRGADLREADLRGVNLYGADLYGANLYGVDLRGANLREAILRGANLYRVNLYGADLYGANLYGVDLRGVDLSGVDLREANLREADLRGVNLRGAVLYRADLRGADLRGAENFTGEELWFKETRCLPEGDIIGYKKCYGGVIVKLLIPKEAKRSQAFGRKCRAEYAKVLEIIGADFAISYFDNTFKYIVGEMVQPTEKFDENWQEECSTGIHFFITKVEAEKY